MVCYLIFKKLVRELLKEYNVTDKQAVFILEDVEKDVGHNVDLIKAVVDFEKKNLIKRLQKGKKSVEKKAAVAYA